MDVFLPSSAVVGLGGSPSATGGSGNYSYSWTPVGAYTPTSSASNPSVTVSASITYTLMVTDMISNCIGTDDKLVYLINEPHYFVLKKMLDAGYYNSYNNKIYFMFEEEYYDPTTNAPLNYTIVTDKNVSISVPTLIEKIGDNRFQLNLTSVSGLVAGDFYRIKITNEKNEVWYARFKY